MERKLVQELLKVIKVINIVIVKVTMKNSAKRDTRPLKGRDLIINVHQGGLKKLVWHETFFLMGGG